MSTAGGRPAGAKGSATPRPTTKPVTPARPDVRDGAAGQARTQTQMPARTAAGPRGDEPRKVRLTLSRLDPFSVMKISFLLSVSIAIAGLVVVAALWMMLSGMGVFDTIDKTLNELAQSTNQSAHVNVLEILSFWRVLSLAVVLGVANVILTTAIATLSAVIYNICSALVGGLSSTYTDI